MNPVRRLPDIYSYFVMLTDSDLQPPTALVATIKKLQSGYIAGTR